MTAQDGLYQTIGLQTTHPHRTSLIINRVYQVKKEEPALQVPLPAEVFCLFIITGVDLDLTTAGVQMLDGHPRGPKGPFSLSDRGQ